MADPVSRRDYSVRSYVLRNSRITSAQKQALKKYWPLYSIQFTETLLDLDVTFGRCSPKILEIGCGMGDTTIKMAMKHPENDYLAVEVYRPGLGNLLHRINTYQLSNIRVIAHDVRAILQHQIPPNSFESIYIFFPDPWPKRKHHKRRLINKTLLPLLKKALADNGRLFIATDWEDYAAAILRLIAEDSDTINLAGPGNYAPRPRWRPVTKFEARSLNKNQRIYDLALTFKKPLN